MRRRYSAEQWAAWIDEQAVSGRTIAGFCESLGVSVNSFYVWRRKLRSETTAAPSRDAESSGGFVQLAIGQARPAGQIEIELPCGALVRVPGDESLLRSVLSVLLDASSQDAGGASC